MYMIVYIAASHRFLRLLIFFDTELDDRARKDLKSNF